MQTLTIHSTTTPPSSLPDAMAKLQINHQPPISAAHRGPLAFPSSPPGPPPPTAAAASRPSTTDATQFPAPALSISSNVPPFAAGGVSHQHLLGHPGGTLQIGCYCSYNSHHRDSGFAEITTST